MSALFIVLTWRFKNTDWAVLNCVSPSVKVMSLNPKEHMHDAILDGATLQQHAYRTVLADMCVVVSRATQQYT